MKRTLIGGCLLCLLLLVSSVTTTAQDFSTLIKAVGKVEANLKTLIEKESANRNKDIAALRGEMKLVDGGSKDGSFITRLNQIEKQIGMLRSEIGNLNAGGNGSGSNDEALSILFTDIQNLKDENRKLMDNANRGNLFVTSDPTETENDVIGGLEISGFLDVISTYQRKVADNSEFGLGQAEVDLANELSDNITAEIAIAYNNETGNFELGAALIDIHLFGGGEKHTRGFAIDHSFIVAGQFDVPFGIDYYVYPSIDRKLVTSPMAVDLTHGGWNDFGLQFGLNATHGNLIVYAINGFEASAEVLDEVETLSTGIDTYETIDTSPANAFGTRLGIAPFSGLEFGSSFATGYNESGKSEMLLWGADFQYSISALELKGEFIYHSLNRSIAEENNRGYYVQTSYDILEQVFVTARYGSFKPDGAQWYGQFSLGAGYTLSGDVGLRFETLISENSSDNLNIMQLVAGF